MRIGITTDCVCDLPEDYLRANGVDLMYFYIITDTGRFKDGYGITSENILEYLEEGGEKAETDSPAPGEYRAFFEQQLKKYDEVIHIAASAYVGQSCAHARAAVQAMRDEGKRVTIVDSGNLSTGLGLMVMRAVELRDSGCPAAEIADAIERMKPRVSTTFITHSVDFLARNGRVGPKVSKLCRMLKLHPVMTLKDGKLKLHGLKVGHDEKAIMRYVRGELKRAGQIDKKRLFITHAGCTVRMIAQIRAEAERRCRFEEVMVTRTSATVSGNCGPGTVGVLYIRH